MIRILDTRHDDVLATLRQRQVRRDVQTEAVVAEIVEDVRRRGDEALLDSARRFDAPALASIQLSEVEFDAAAHLPKQHRDALEFAADRIREFHQDQLAWIRRGLEERAGASGFEGSWRRSNGEAIGQRVLNVTGAGVYVPGGNAYYPSSVLMNAIPARVAGVEKVAVTTPARKDGTLHPSLILALRLAGVDKAYKVGGAAAIAALALGTETIERVDKIVGPGNRYVNEAKRQLWGAVGLDGYAGPSEVCVLADDTANAAFAAADLLTQVEHAPDNAGFLVTLSREKMSEILVGVERQLTGAPREVTMRDALANMSLAIIARDLAEAIDLVNAIAPEHCTLAVQDPEAALHGLRNAGCALLGEYTPESAGDYCLGPSHTLPTGGAARWQSPVNVLDFLKLQSFAHLGQRQLQPLISTIETLGEIEGFPTHAAGATIRRT